MKASLMLDVLRRGHRDLMRIADINVHPRDHCTADILELCAFDQEVGMGIERAVECVSHEISTIEAWMAREGSYNMRLPLSPDMHPYVMTIDK